MSTSSLLPSQYNHLTDSFTANSLLARNVYLSNYGTSKLIEEKSTAEKVKLKVWDEYRSVKDLADQTAPSVSHKKTQLGDKTKSALSQAKSKVVVEEEKEEVKAVKKLSHEHITFNTSPSSLEDIVESTVSSTEPIFAADPSSTSSSSSSSAALSTALVLSEHQQQQLVASGNLTARQLLIAKQRERDEVRPDWHAPWKLMRVIAGHTGWVRCVAVDPSNEFFVTGSVDRTIKIWDLASGQLKLTLTGHISAVRGVQLSNRHPYLFSCGEDKTVKCWDLEVNKVIRSYHGHLSGVYSLALHPTLDILISGGRDSVARVWDMRTKSEIASLSGHTGTVSAIGTQSVDPQVITGAHDNTIKLWDLAERKCYSTLTHHKKSVRALQVHHTEYTFASAAADNLKVWKCPRGDFLRNVSGHNDIVNCMTLNRENVLFSGGDSGKIHAWDWKTGHNFQVIDSPPQPGSLESEKGIFAMTMDNTGSRLITAEADKSIKVYKEDPNATPETHPLNFNPKRRRRV